MKTVISSKADKALEVAKRILYSLKVVSIGLFIPLLFILGISGNTPQKTKKDKVNYGKPYQLNNDQVTVDFNQTLWDHNS